MGFLRVVALFGLLHRADVAGRVCAAALQAVIGRVVYNIQASSVHVAHPPMPKVGVARCRHDHLFVH